MNKSISSPGTLMTAFLLCVFIICASLIVPKGLSIEKDARVSVVLESLGYNGQDHFPNTDIFGVSAKRGENLVLNGFSTKPGGGKTKKQSKHFVCTSCHNIEKEDPDLRFNDPQARLEYTSQKGIPFLQGTSLYGAVNRESFYNDDYYKKYGELVNPARNNIREAIQLCAVECAQGRKLKPWEIESILAYLWTIDLKMEDLDFTEEEFGKINASYTNKEKQSETVDLILSKYSKSSPAHFGSAQESFDTVVGLTGNPDNGQLIYDNSCMHCHKDRRYSFFALDNEKVTFKHLLRKANSFNKHSIFQVSRYGVYPKAGKRSYMPQYPKEKMSDQQLADLLSYIEFKASE